MNNPENQQFVRRIEGYYGMNLRNCFKSWIVLLIVSFSVTGSVTANPLADLAAVDSSGPAELFGSSQQFTPADDQGRFVFMIEFDEPGLLDLHRQTRGFGQRFDSRAPDIRAESDAMVARHQSALGDMGARLGRSVDATHFFQITHSGVAVRLTELEARQVAELPGVASIQRERQYFLDTFAGPEFIGAGSVWDGSATPSGEGLRGAGMIAGVLDSGILPNHPSFINDPACGHGEGDIPNKLISFVDCSATNSQGLCAGTNPVDVNGHGTHVAGTKAGNALLRDSGPEPRPNPPVGEGVSGVAPCASIRNYKVCPGNNCPGAHITAGLNTLLDDGDVDTMNFSISGPGDPWSATNSNRRFLDLVDSQVFVNASAGNTNATVTNPVGQVNHRGPWVMSVAASTRPGGAPDGTVTITGPGTPPGNLIDVPVLPGSNSSIPDPVIEAAVRFDPDQPPGADGCEGFPADFFDGAIALVHRGTCAFTDKINNAAEAGAIMVIIRNNQAGALSMSTPGQADVPAYSISSQAIGDALRDFIAANPGATLRFEVADTPQGDVLAGFSFRGPTPSPLQHLQKPDITAPGVSIYAADVDPTGFGNKSGTSMSGPHLSGAALLVRQMNPDWTPLEVASAIRMTAKKDGFKDDATSDWDWDDVGSGRVELTRAGLSGLVMNETFDNFLTANPATGGDVRTLNLPAVRNVACSPSCTFTRTVRNTLNEPTSWAVGSEVISGDFTVTVSPSSFSFTGDTSETQTLEITLAPNGTIPLSFGTINFVEADGLSPELHFTVALAGSGEGAPEPEGVTGFEFEGTVTGVTGNFTWASDLAMVITSPAGDSFSVGGLTTGFPPWDFQGAVSTEDGTYESSHPDAFALGTALDGNWELAFEHNWSDGNPMTWDPITIELTGPGREVLGVLNVPAFTVEGGASTFFTIPVGDAPPPPEDPAIEVSPASVEQSLLPNATATQTLDIANVGQGTLEFEVAYQVSGTILPARSITLWEQAVSATNGIISGLQLTDNLGAYSADDFVLTEDVLISTVLAEGFNNGGAMATLTESVTWYIFPDENGVPAGDPETNPGAAVFTLTAEPGDPGLDLTDNNIFMDLVANTGGPVALPAGRYWLSVVPAFNFAIGAADAARWNWFAGAPIQEEESQLISPGIFGVANWTPITSLVGPDAAALAGLAFTITGVIDAGPPVECEATPPGWLTVDPETGSVEAGDVETLTVGFDAAGLSVGLFETALCISSNDPANPLVIVPVTLEVEGEPAAIAVTPPQVDGFVEAGGPSVDFGLSVANLGDGDLEWAFEGGDRSVAGTLLRTGSAASAPGLAHRGQFAVDNFLRDLDVQRGQIGSHSMRAPTTGTTLTHSASFDIMTGNTSVCSTDGGATTRSNAFLRVFDLADFGILDAFAVEEVTFGVENSNVEIDVDVNVYTLDGDFLYENLELIGSTTTTLAPSSLTLVNVPVSAFADIGSTIVVEVQAPNLSGIGAFRPGSNQDGETAPSYVVSPACNVPEPTSFADLGLSNVNLVMSVTGQTSIVCAAPNDISWLSADATGGTVFGGDSQQVTLTFNDGGQPAGTELRQNLCIASNDPSNSLVVVPTTLTVVDEGETAPLASVDPASIDTAAIQGDTVIENVTVSNLGTANLDWSLDDEFDGTSVLLSQNFAAAAFPPAGWSSVNLSGSNPQDWRRDTFQSNTPPASAHRRWSVASAGFQNDWLVSPVISLADNSLLTFADRGGFMTFYTGSFIQVSTGSCDPADGDFVEVAEINDSPNNAWRDGVEIDLSAFDNQDVCIAFQYTGTDGHSWWIDDVVVSSEVFPPADPTGCHDFSEDDWLSVNPASGTINPSGQQILDVTFNSDGLAPGLYEAELCLFSNDPGANPARIPVTFDVIEFNPIAEITPDQFTFEVFEGRTANGDLLIGNVGTTPLTWSVDTANLLPGLSYVEALDRSVGEPSLPMGWDRASGLQAEGEVDHIVEGAAFGRAVDGPIIEGFDDVTLLPSRGWVLANLSQPVGTNSWFQGNPAVFTAFEGDANSYIAVNFASTSGAGLINNWLLTPETVLRNGTEIRFFTRADTFSDFFPDRLEVRYSTSGNSINVGSSADDVGDFVNLVASINPELQPGGYPTEWTEVVIRLEGLPEPVAGRVALRYFVEDGGPSGSNSNFIGIDSFSITQPIACEFPETVDWLSLSFFSGGGTGVTDPGDVDSVTVNVDTDGLALGEYEAKVCVTTNDPAAELVEIPVSLTVLGIPVADVAPGSFDFVANAGESDEGSLTITNIGTADLVWNIDTAPASGPTGAPNSVFADWGEDQGSVEVYVGGGNPSHAKGPSGNTAVFRSTDGTVALTHEEITSLARVAGRTGPTLSVNGVTTGGFRDSGDPNNTLLALPIGAGNELLGVGWEVTIETFGISWLEESTMTVSTNFGGDGISINPGGGIDSGGVQTFSSGGVLMFADFGLPSIPANANGDLAIEWHEINFVDVPAGPDSEWSDPADGLVLPPGLRLICTDQAACDEAVEPSTPEPPPVPERCVNPAAVDWLSVSETSGVTAVGETSELTVTADASALLGGMYEASLCITTNEPDGVGLIEIPITFEVLNVARALVSPTDFSFDLVEGESDTGVISIESIGQLAVDWSLNESVRSIRAGELLFSNADIVTNPGAGAGGADVSALQTGLGMSTFGAGVQQTAGNRMSDSFEVDGNWSIDNMSFFVYQTGSPPTSTITSVSLRIWDGPPNAGGEIVFGDPTTNRLLETSFSGIYRTLDTQLTNTDRPIMEVVADLEGLQLSPGTYWVDVSFGGSLASGPWMGPRSILGETTTGTDSWQFTASSGTWVPWNDTGSNTRQGMPFEVRGSADAAVCVAPADVPWLSADPESGSVAPGDTETTTLTIDSTGLLSGVSSATLCVYTNDAEQPVVPVLVTLDVTAAPDSGVVEGSVQSLGYCDDNPFSAAGATVTVSGSGGPLATTVADEDGNFAVAVSSLESPVSVTASAPDHVSVTIEDVIVSDGESTTVDFDLRIEQGCTSVFQDEFLVMLGLGESESRTLDLTNVGAAASSFSIESPELRSIVEAAIWNLGRESGDDLRDDGQTRAGLIGASEPVIRNIEVTVPRSDINVLILSPDGEAGTPIGPLNLESDLNAFPGINAEIFSGTLATITLADFDGFDVAVLTNNNRWVDANADVSVGNALADFVDEGGAVVLHNFAYDFFGFQLAGRFITENYGPITPSTSDVQAASQMVVLEPDSPLFDNVTSIGYGTNFRLTGSSLTAGATLMAQWDDGVPMVTMNDHSVSINAMYSSDGEQGDWSGDLNVLVYNAVVMLAGPQEGDGAAWLTVDPVSGSVPADDSAVVNLTFDADELEAGEYQANIRVEIDDGLGEVFTVVIPATMLVGEAQVQIAHLAPFAGDRSATAVDVVVNGDTVLSGVSYGDSTGYLTLPPGPTVIEIFPMGAAEPAMTASVALAPGEFYTVLAIGDGTNQDLQLKLLVDDQTPPEAGTFHLRLGHVAPFASGSATADVRLRDGSPECPAVLENVDFGDVSGFIALPPGEYDLIITSPGGCNVLIDPAPVSFAEGDIASAFATGDGVNQPLGAFALAPGLPGDFLPLVIPGELSVSPVELEFGDVTLGETETREITVSNVAGEDAEALVLTGLAIGAGAFAITDQGDCVLGSILAAGESCTVEVSFAPTAAGTFSDDLVISAGDGQSQSVPVSGTGVQLPGALAVDPMVLAFGAVLVGDDAVLTMTVSNSAPQGAMAITIDQFELSGDSVFGLAGGDCVAGLELAPGDDCSIMIDFAPSAAQEYSGQLEIEANGQTALVNLTGRGFERGMLGVAPDDVDFGDVMLGRSSSVELTVTNTAAMGSAAVAISGVVILPDGDFEVTGGSCEASVTSLEPGEDCTIMVTFTPSSLEAVAATLLIDGSDGKKAAAALNGRGIEPVDRIFDDRFEASSD